MPCCLADVLSLRCESRPGLFHRYRLPVHLEEDTSSFDSGREVTSWSVTFPFAKSRYGAAAPSPLHARLGLVNSPSYRFASELSQGEVDN